MKSVSNLSRKSEILRTYNRLASSAQTDNDFRKIQVSLENRLSPIEWTHLHSHLAEKYHLQGGVIGRIKQALFSVPGKSRFSEKRSVELEFVVKYKNAQDEAYKKGPATFRRVVNTHGISHFVHPKNNNKSLLVIWTGAARRPMMPLHTFLQAVWERNVDVLVLRAKPNQGYVAGVAGLGGSLEKAIDGLCEFRDKRQYSQVYVVGTSMGTPPALLSSGKLKAENCLLAGPVDPRVWFSNEFRNYMGDLGDQRSSHMVTTVVGELATTDAAAADYLSSLLGTTKIVIPRAAHNPLWPIARRGELADWLKQYLFLEVG